MKPKSRLLTIGEVLEQTRIKSRCTIWKWRRAGKFPEPVAVGERLKMWREADVQNWIDELPGRLN